MAHQNYAAAGEKGQRPVAEAVRQLRWRQLPAAGRRRALRLRPEHQQIWHLLQLFQKRRAPSGRRAARRDNEADRRQALCAVPSGVCVEGEESALLSGLRRQAETAEGSRTAAPKAASRSRF